MAFCINCGHELEDNAKFCAKCGKEADSSSSPMRKTVYDGEIHKCPNCGEALASFIINCPSCGYEIRGAKNSTSVQEISAKLEAIEKSRPAKNSGLRSFFENQNEVTETDMRKISLIRSFVIPNTKEDLLEFLVLASSNINLQRYSTLSGISASEQAVSDAWEAKFEQAYEKAKLSFDHSPEFEKIHTMYLKKNGEIKSRKKKSGYVWIGFGIFFAIFSLVLFISVSRITSSENKQIDAENLRLEAIVEEVYAALEDGNYVLARAKAASLVFSGPYTSTASLATEKWDKTRSELLEIISDTEKNGSENTVESATTNNSATDNNNFPDTNGTFANDSNSSANTESTMSTSRDITNDFVAGYEKAEFDKFNSLEAGNNLADSLIYFYCKIDKTELLDTGDSTMILGHVIDDFGNKWLVELHIFPVVSTTFFDSYVGQEIILRGVYAGFSKAKDMPVVILDEMVVLATGETIIGLQKLLDE